MSVTGRIRVLVVDDHPIFARGLIDCLSRQHDIECVGAANSGPAALELAAHHTPDVVVLDAFLLGTDVPTLARNIREAHPGVSLLVLSEANNDTQILKLVRAGVDGYLFKDCDGEELAQAIRVVHRGESYLAPVAASQLVHHFRLLTETRQQSATNGDGLTDREMTVLELLATGKSNREIAEALFLSERTVENHARNLYRKLGVHDRTQAILVAMQRGYVHAPHQGKRDRDSLLALLR